MFHHRSASLLLPTAVACLTAVAPACTVETSSSDPTQASQTSAAMDLPTDNYLAIGDSVPFGFDPTQFSRDPSAPLPPATAFVGYPDVVAADVKPIRDANIACPGETSTSFTLSLDEVIARLTAAAQDPAHPAPAVDRGCYQAKSKGLLHVPYTVSQADRAVAFLKSHPQTKLVTITLGGNDVGAVQDFCNATSPDAATAQSCAFARLPAALGALQANLTTILGRVRGEAGYKGKLLAVTYYSLDYRVPPQYDGLYAVDGVLASVAAQFGGGVVSGYDAFKAAVGADGSPCNAGLLIPIGQLPTGALVCDVHPTLKGRQLLASAVEAAL